MEYPPLSNAHADVLLARLKVSRDTLPDWYLRRWHFHPDGYLSAAGVRWYDRIVRLLYNWPAESAVAAYVAHVIRRTRATSLVDAGCGQGRLVASLARALPRLRILGVDLSPAMVGNAHRRVAGGIDVGIERADLLSIDLTSRLRGPIDCVVLAHVLGHVPVEVAEAMAARLAQSLRPGGHMIVVDHAWHPRAAALGELIRRGGRSFRGGMIRVAVYQRPHGLPS